MCGLRPPPGLRVFGLGSSWASSLAKALVHVVLRLGWLAFRIPQQQLALNRDRQIDNGVLRCTRFATEVGYEPSTEPSKTLGDYSPAVNLLRA